MVAMAKTVARVLSAWLAGLSEHQILMEGSISEIAAAMKKKRIVTITRDPSTKEGTFGTLKAGCFECYTLEPEWLNNERGFSCIPVGEYECAPVLSNKFGAVYGIKTDHIKRDNVLIHAGNFGATLPGKSDTEGCIMLGRAIGEIAKQRALLSSKDALKAFMDEMEGESFTLRITWKEAK